MTSISEAENKSSRTLSHEIRGRMTAIYGMLWLLRRTSLSDTQEKYIVKALEASDQLIGLLDETWLDSKKQSSTAFHSDADPVESKPGSVEARGDSAEMARDIAVIRSGQYLPTGDRIALLRQLRKEYSAELVEKIDKALANFDYVEAARLIGDFCPDTEGTPEDGQ